MNIKEVRKKSGKSQLEVAKVLGISQQNLCRYENEQYQPDIQILIKLADYFNVSLDYLCNRQYNNQIGYIPEDKKEVVKLILQLNQVNTIKLFGYVSGLLAGQN